MSTPITATQALEWAKEDVEALVSGANAHSERDEGLNEAARILDRWIRRVQDVKPTSRFALAPETRDRMREVAGLD